MKAGHSFGLPAIVIDEMPYTTPEEDIDQSSEGHEMVAGAPHKRGRIVLTMQSVH
jgi:hypothetical protein